MSKKFNFVIASSKSKVKLLDCLNAPKEILFKSESLEVYGDGLLHSWKNNSNHYFLFGYIDGLRRADGSISDPSMYKLELDLFEAPKGVANIEGRFICIKIQDNFCCEIWSDRAGRAELYYQYTEDSVFIASGLDLLPVSLSGSSVSPVGMAHALTVYGNRPAKMETLYECVKKVGVGSMLSLNRGNIELSNPQFTPTATGEYSSTELNKYSDVLLEAIRARGSMDGNVVSLSSGWDSTAILASLVHLFGKNKVRAVIGRMRYANRSGVVNQFEIDRAQAFADYYHVKLDICDLTYCDNGPDLLDRARPLLRAQQFSNLSAISQWIIAQHVAKTATGNEVLFNGEMSDGAHNLGFSQFVTIFHPESYDFREYSDKMASYLYGPTFMRQLISGTYESDPIWQLFKNRAGSMKFDELAGVGVPRKMQLFSSFFLRGGRMPLNSLQNSQLLTGKGRDNYATQMERNYLTEAATQALPETLYSWYLHLYNSFHWQTATVLSRVHAALEHGLKPAMPFSDSQLIEWLSAMPENWGRGLDLNPTKYPLKWMLKNKIDYPMHLQKGPHSYLYDVDPTFSHMGEILFGSSFTPVFKDALSSNKLQDWIGDEYFDQKYIQALVRRYLNNEEFRGQEMNDLGVLAMQSAIGFYGE